MSRVSKLECEVHGCERPSVAKRVCKLHWDRIRRTGQVGPAGVTVSHHGLSGTRTHLAWQEMKRRCLDPRRQNYANYGGRGIRVYEGWVTSFESFLADMGECPTGLSLDRINNDLGYFPGNCRWATRRQQTLNRRAFGASRFRGVQRISNSTKWRAGIAPRRGLFISLGTYEEEAAAAMAWNRAALAFYGTDANLNWQPLLPANVENAPV